MQNEKTFRASTYKLVEKQVDEWLTGNPHVDIISTTTAEEGTETEPGYSFIMTIRYEGLEGTAD
jgi:hypothetical protein